MVIAGEASGDLLAAELVRALRQEFAEAQFVPTNDYLPLETSLAPQFFGAGGPRMAAEGVELAVEMTTHSVIGISGVAKNLLKFRRFLHQLYQLALERQPDAVICVDFSGFNRRLAHAVKEYARAHRDWFHDWDPKVIQYVSPQVWASREGREYKMARDFDLLLSTFAFEKEWYARRVPRLRVEFVGNPIVDRYGEGQEPNVGKQKRETGEAGVSRVEGGKGGATPTVLLLPGSRRGELHRHLPVLVRAAQEIATEGKAAFRMVLPEEELAEYATPFVKRVPEIEVRVGQMEEALRDADLAITKSGTITLECAYLGVPAVVFYKTSWVNYVAARQVVKVKHLAMPNLLAGEEVFPEFIQGAATAENLARAALQLLEDQNRRAKVKAKLAEIRSSLGEPGASRRAAKVIAGLVKV